MVCPYYNRGTCSAMPKDVLKPSDSHVLSYCLRTDACLNCTPFKVKQGKENRPEKVVFS